MFRLGIRNFQSIKSIDLEVKGLTALLGRSHQGKSAIVRSVDTLLTSTWYQDAYMRKGETQTSVTIEHEGGDSLTFVRNGSKTTYTVNGKHIAKLNGNAPPEFKDLGWGEVKVGESKEDVYQITPQIQHQFDIPYNDQLRPAIMTQLIGSFADLSKYQVAHTKSRSEQTELRRESERTQVELGKVSAIAEQLVQRDPSYGYRLLAQAAELGSALETAIGSANALVGLNTLSTKVSSIHSTARQTASHLRTSYSLASSSAIRFNSDLPRQIQATTQYLPRVSQFKAVWSVLKSLPTVSTQGLDLPRLLPSDITTCKSVQRLIASRHLGLMAIIPLAQGLRMIKDNLTPIHELIETKYEVASQYHTTSQEVELYKAHREDVVNLFESGHCPLCHSKLETTLS